MYETTLTVLGRVATTVTQVTFNDGGLKASFRLASRERRFDRDQQTWVDGAQLFLGVVCWRNLADRVVATLRVGDPVIVRGRLRRTRVREGRPGALRDGGRGHVDRSGPRALFGERAEARRRTPGEGDATRSQSADGEGGQRDRWESGSRAEAAVGRNRPELPSLSWQSSFTACSGSGRPMVTRSSSTTSR